MLSTRSLGNPFRTMVTNAKLRLESDAAREGRGGGRGCRAHELLESAVAARMNISLRHGLELAP